MYTLKHDGKTLHTSETLNKSLDWLHKNTSGSWEWNFRYEGYKIFKNKEDITKTLLYDQSQGKGHLVSNKNKKKAKKVKRSCP